MNSNLQPDALIRTADRALRTLFAQPQSQRSMPDANDAVTVDSVHDHHAAEAATELNAQERQHAGALMRINHVGEICAQALYAGQAFATRNEALRTQFIEAGAEEADHLAWTANRLKALGARPSLLNPLWYAGSFGLGILASSLGDRLSLGFMVETERQVEAHLGSHLAAPQDGGLPEADHASRAVVAQMLQEEAAHAHEAELAGAAELPEPAKKAMRAMARVMTRTAYYI
jgi:3-demethoxyubiquinol 3-hydroxylase